MAHDETAKQYAGMYYHSLDRQAAWPPRPAAPGEDGVQEVLDALEGPGIVAVVTIHYDEPVAYSTRPGGRVLVIDEYQFSADENERIRAAIARRFPDRAPA